MKPDLSPFIPKLIECLRQELQEYGEMLSLLEQQQASVMTRVADEVLQSVVLITGQLARIKEARQRRECCQKDIAGLLGQATESNFAVLTPLLPEQFRLGVEMLVRENNQCLVRVQQRVRQNHLLMSRSLQLMQEFMNALIPSAGPTTYDQGGQVQAPGIAGTGLYEAVG